jgi:hypothetical protein
MVYLEPRAAAHSGRVVELADFSEFDFLEKGKL